MRQAWLKGVLVCVVIAASLIGIVVLSMQKPQDNSERIAVISSAAKMPPNEADGDIVYRTPSGTKYHLSAKCLSLANSKSIEEITIALARESGLSACSRCGE